MTFDSFYKDLLKPFKSRLWLTALCAAGVSASAVALLGLSGWFLTASAVAGAIGPVAAQAFNYLLPSAFIRFFAIARTALRYGERYLGHSAALRAMARLRPALFQHLTAAPPEAMRALSRGEVSSHFIQDVTTLETALVMQSAPAGAIGGLSAAAILCAWASPVAALVLLIFMAAALVVGLRWQRPPSVSQTEPAAMGAVKARFYEIMAVLPDVRAFDLQAPLLAELESLETQLRLAKRRTGMTEAMAQGALTGLTGLALCAITSVTMADGIANLALALLAASMGFESLGALLKAMSQYRLAAAARARVAGVFELPEYVADAPGETRLSHGKQTFPLDRALRLRIDGPSGSGKTRLIEELLGLRPSAQHFDRSLFSLCPQDAGLLTGTLRENLTLALGDETLKAVKAELDTRLWTALEDAALKDRVTALPKGLDTWVGDGGVTLSGGERKRLALARAYLRDAPILVLDEPTEGLDLKTEAVVVERLGERLRRENQGLILVSHREAPRHLANKVLRL